MDPEEIKNFLKESKSNPSDYFSDEAMKADPWVKGFVKEKKGNMAGFAERKESEFNKERDKWNDERTELNDKIKELSTKVLKNDFSGQFDKIATDRKLNEEQVGFVKKRFEKFNPDLEKPEESFKKFVDDSIQEHKDLLPYFGVKSEKTEEKPGNGKDNKGSLIPGVKDGKKESENPLIPQEEESLTF